MFNLRRHRVANFAGIIEIEGLFIKKTFKEPKKIKTIENYAFLYLYFLI